MSNDLITIMFVRGSGRIRTVKIALNKLIFLGCGIITLLAALVFVSLQYVDLYRETQALRTQVETSRQSHLLAYNPGAASEHSVHRTIPDQSPSVRQPSATDTLQTATGQTGTPAVQQTVYTSSTEETVQSPVLSVGEFEALYRQDTRGISIKFKLNNSTREQQRITGFVTVVVDQGTAVKSNDRFVTFPIARTDTEGGVLNFREGDFFAISRWKPVEVDIPLVCTDKDIRDISIFIYSEEGELLLKKVFAPSQAAA